MLGYTLFVIFATASVGFLSSKLQDPLFLANFQLSESTAGVYTLVSNLAVFMFVFLIMVFLSNRIAGPLFRLRKEMKRVAEGGSPRALTFRKSDLFQAIAIQYNVLIEKRFK